GAEGATLLGIGAHDGAPDGTDGGARETAAWFKRYLAKAPKHDRHSRRHDRKDRPREREGPEHSPGVGRRIRHGAAVQLWLADGDREDLLDGKYVRYDGSDWPIPHTRWESLALDPARSGTARSINDGTLGLKPPGQTTTQSYAAVPTLPTNGDP